MRGDVRLVGDTRNGYGAVQLFDGSQGWITVCYDDTWSTVQADIVCRQLGYETGQPHRLIFTYRKPHVLILILGLVTVTTEHRRA